MNQFAQRLRTARNYRRLTQDELGQKAHMNTGNIAHYEAEQRLPSVVNLVALANALQVSTDYLLGRTEERHATHTAPARYAELATLCEQMSEAHYAVVRSVAQALAGVPYPQQEGVYA